MRYLTEIIAKRPLVFARPIVEVQEALRAINCHETAQALEKIQEWVREGK